MCRGPVSEPSQVVNGSRNDICAKSHEQTHISRTIGRQRLPGRVAQPIVQNRMIFSSFLPSPFLFPLMNLSSVRANNRDSGKRRSRQSPWRINRHQAKGRLMTRAMRRGEWAGSGDGGRGTQKVYVWLENYMKAFAICSRQPTRVKTRRCCRFSSAEESR